MDRLGIKDVQFSLYYSLRNACNLCLPALMGMLLCIGKDKSLLYGVYLFLSVGFLGVLLFTLSIEVDSLYMGYVGRFMYGFSDGITIVQ